MSESPSPTASNGRGTNGKFGPGNRYAKGNPFAKRVARLRSALFKAVSPADLRHLLAALLTQAKAGDVASSNGCSARRSQLTWWNGWTRWKRRSASLRRARGNQVGIETKTDANGALGRQDSARPAVFGEATPCPASSTNSIGLRRRRSRSVAAPARLSQRRLSLHGSRLDAQGRRAPRRTRGERGV